MYSDVALHTFASVQTRFEVSVLAVEMNSLLLHTSSRAQLRSEAGSRALVSYCVSKLQVVASPQTEFDVAVAAIFVYLPSAFRHGSTAVQCRSAAAVSGVSSKNPSPHGGVALAHSRSVVSVFSLVMYSDVALHTFASVQTRFEVSVLAVEMNSLLLHTSSRAQLRSEAGSRALVSYCVSKLQVVASPQ